jgi:hypothetical protein
MINARNAVIAAFIIAGLSLALTVGQLMLPPDSGGLAHDSYGTRAFGHRALYELLGKLGVPVERGLVPPSGHLRRDVCLVLWNPDPRLADAEPEHLRRIRAWVREGGAAIIAPPRLLPDERLPLFEQKNPFSEGKTILEELGLPGVRMSFISAGVAVDLPAAEEPASRENSDTAPESADGAEEDEEAPFSPFRSRARPPALRAIAVEAEGELADCAGKIRSLRAPVGSLQIIENASTVAVAGRLVSSLSGSSRTLVALYALGRGRIAVVSDPTLFLNFAVGKGDNAVLAAHLFARFGRPVIFDEFYHGLTVRGNPVWLFTRRPYNLLVVLVLLAAGVWVWRGAVHLGPPLPERLTKRRTLREYVEAMANIFHRGRCRAFVLKEVRDGTLWALRRRLNLSPAKESPRAIAQALARKDPDAAERLTRAIDEIDALLGSSSRPGERAVVEHARKVAQCL